MNRKTSSISLNCTLSAPPTTLPGVHTPNTPEILNTIVNITSQMCQQLEQHQPSNMPVNHPPTLPSPSYMSASSTKYSLCSSMSSSSSLHRSPNTSNPIVQNFKSQFIKDGLKMKVRQNLKMEPEDSLKELLTENIKTEIEDHSPEDDVKRFKRRERNKVAAEKCRNKKKKETLNLFSESKSVEKANACYKDDIARLEAEQRHLMNILAQHQPQCRKRQRAEQASWHFDESNTFRIPSLPAIKERKGGGSQKAETEDIVMLDDDYSEVQSDCQMESEEQKSKNVFQPCSFVRSTPGQFEGQTYANLNYMGYTLASSYHDSMCAAV